MQSSQTNYNETTNSLNITNDLISNSSTYNDLNSSHKPMTNSNINNINIPNQHKPVEPKKKDPGFFGRFANYLKVFGKLKKRNILMLMDLFLKDLKKKFH